MKKTLLGGTAALGMLFAAPVMSQDAPAEAPASTAAKLTISGTTSFHMSAFKQDAPTAASTPSGSGSGASGKGQGYNFSQDDSSLDFTFAGRTDTGIDYLGRINFTGQTGPANVGNNYSVRSRVRQNYVQLGFMGATIQGGDLWGTETTSVNDGSAVMKGDGGFGSNWSSRFNEPYDSGSSTGNVVYGAYLAGTSGTATKVTVLTPTVFGFHASATLTPNTAHVGDIYHNNSSNPQGTTPAADYFDQNHQAYSLSFNNHFGPMNVSVSGAVLMSSKTKDSNNPAGGGTYEPTKGFTVGTVLSAYGFDLGVGYYDNKKTGVTKANAALGKDGGKVMNAALGWSMGQFAVAVGYLNGERKTASVAGVNKGKAKSDVYSITADMRLADGLTVYGDLNYAKMKDPTITTEADGTSRAENKGTVFLLGTRVNF